jgi:hypothetical protein
MRLVKELQTFSGPILPLPLLVLAELRLGQMLPAWELLA